jgi:hypothetical protein
MCGYMDQNIFPFSMLFLRKWYLTSKCLVLEWRFATLMALVLSHWSGTWVYTSPKSLMVYVIQRSWEQQLTVATYSASVVDWATLDCLQEDQDTKEEPKNWQVPKVDVLSNRHPAKSASEKPWSTKKVPKAEVGSVTQVLDNLLHRLPMQSPGRLLTVNFRQPRVLVIHWFRLWFATNPPLGILVM